MCLSAVDVHQLFVSLLDRDNDDVRAAVQSFVSTVLSTVCQALPTHKQSSHDGRGGSSSGGAKPSSDDADAGATRSLVTLTLSLLRPYHLPHFDLAVTLSRHFPAHVDAYLPSFSHSLEPRPSLQWLSNAALACQLLLPLRKSLVERRLAGGVGTSIAAAAAGAAPTGVSAIGRDDGGHDDVWSVLPSVWALPPSATKAALTRGCLHANKLVAYVTLNVVLCALRRLGAVTACLRTTDSDSGSGSGGVGSSTGHSSGSSSSGGGAVVVAPISAGASSVAEVKARRAAAAALATAAVRLPEVQTLVNVVQHCAKKGVAKDDDGNAVGFAHRLLYARALTVLRLYCKYLPGLVAASRFDLVNLFDDGCWQDDLVLLEVGIMECGCLVVW